MIPIVKILLLDEYDRIGLYWTVYKEDFKYKGICDIEFSNPTDMRKFLKMNHKLISSNDKPIAPDWKSKEITYFKVIKYQPNKRAKSKKVKKIRCIVERIKLRELNLEKIGI